MRYSRPCRLSRLSRPSYPCAVSAMDQWLTPGIPPNKRCVSSECGERTASVETAAWEETSRGLRRVCGRARASPVLLGIGKLRCGGNLTRFVVDRRAGPPSSPWLDSHKVRAVIQPEPRLCSSDGFGYPRGYGVGGIRANRNAFSMTSSDSHIPDDRRFITT